MTLLPPVTACPGSLLNHTNTPHTQPDPSQCQATDHQSHSSATSHISWDLSTTTTTTTLVTNTTKLIIYITLLHHIPWSDYLLFLRPASFYLYHIHIQQRASAQPPQPQATAMPRPPFFSVPSVSGKAGLRGSEETAQSENGTETKQYKVTTVPWKE